MRHGAKRSTRKACNHDGCTNQASESSMGQRLLTNRAITRDATILLSNEVSALGMVQSVIVTHAATTSASALQFKEESA